MSELYKKIEKINIDCSIENEGKKKLSNGTTIYFATLKRGKKNDKEIKKMSELKIIKTVTDLNELYSLVNAYQLSEFHVKTDSEFLAGEYLEDVIPFSSHDTIVVTDLKLVFNNIDIEINNDDLLDIDITTTNNQNTVLIKMINNTIVLVFNEDGSDLIPKE